MEEKTRYLQSIIGYILPSLIICIIGVLYFVLLPEIAEPEKTALINGEEYYVSVALLEVNPKNPNSDSWDIEPNTAPDLYTEIYWKGQRVFLSSTKDNTLLAKWSETEVDLRDMALSGKNASADEIIRAARIVVDEKSPASIKIYDEDYLAQDDLIGEFKLDYKKLNAGLNKLKNITRSIVQVEVRVVPIPGE